MGKPNQSWRDPYELSVEIEIQILEELGLDPKKLFYNMTEEERDDMRTSTDSFQLIDVDFRPKQEKTHGMRQIILEITTKIRNIPAVFGPTFGDRCVYTLDVETGQPTNQSRITTLLSSQLTKTIKSSQAHRFMSKLLNRKNIVKRS